MGEPLAHHGTHSSNGATHDSQEKALEANIIEQERTSSTTADVAPVKRKGGFKRHCARFWWVHLIVFCVIFLIVALCLVYVAMPKIAQHDVDASHLELTELKFLDPTTNTFTIQQRAILHNPSKFTPTLDGFLAASYYVSNKTGWSPYPLTSFNIAKMHATRPSALAVVSPQKADIANMDQAKAYTTAVLQEEYVTTALVGRTALHLGKLPSTVVNYNTSVTYKGLNGLKGFAVNDMKLNLTATPGNPNLVGVAFIPNPSVITIALGNVTLILSTTAAGVIGNATINEMTVVPGENHFPMSCTIDNAKVIASMVDGMVDLRILGNSSIYNGQHLPYYEAALSSTSLALSINATKLIDEALHPKK